MPRRKPGHTVPATSPKVFRIVGGRVSAGPRTPTDSEPPPAVETAAVPRPPTQEQVRELAYRKWEAAGRPAGDGVGFWLEAERELNGR